MFDKLEEVEHQFEKVQRQLQNPDVVADQVKYKALMIEFSDLESVVLTYRKYKDLKAEITGHKDIIHNESDAELVALAKSEISSLEKELIQLSEQLQFLLLPQDPNDNKNVILEIRAGAGGDEASLFAEELFRAYNLFSADKKWQVDLLSYSDGNSGGAKEIVASITGDKVYSQLKAESGVHRVQRVPKTESQGRVHTSTITVVVLPEAEEVDVDLDRKDVKVDVYRSSGAGGQHVNTTDSAVRLTHLPTGTVVTCQDEKSQTKNKEKAFKVLFSRLKALEDEKAIKEASDARKGQIGTGDRSERIRTYNFPQTRITDHRIGLTIHKLSEVMNGHFENLIDPLITHYQSEALKNQS